MFLLPSVWLGAQVALSQTSFRLFNARDGLPDNKVAQLLETRNSPYHWAITRNELCRFDGYRFQTVWEKLPEISGFAENSRGELVVWHYGGTQALSVFEPNSWKKTVRTTAQIPNLKGQLVSAWAQDTMVFICTEAANNEGYQIWRLFPDYKAQLLYHLRTDPELLRRLPSPKPKPVGHFDEKNARLWLSANLLGKNNKILRVEVKTARCDTFALSKQLLPPEASVRMSQSSELPLRVFIAALNMIWTWNEQAQIFENVMDYPRRQTGLIPIGEDKKGAVIFRKSDQGFIDFWLRRADGSWLDLQPILPKLNFNTCTGSDFSRQIHFATVEGVLRVNFEKPLFGQFVPKKTAQMDFLNPAFRGIIADRMGKVWLASEMSGLYRMRPDGSYERTEQVEKTSGAAFKTDNAVNLQSDAQGFIWSARNSVDLPNLFRFDPKNGIADTFSFEKQAISTFLMLKNGKVLLAANAGKTAQIALFDPATRHFQTLVKTGESGRFKTSPLFFLENEAGQIWTAGNEGLALFDPPARKFLDFPGNNPTAQEFPVAVLLLVNEALWCGTLGGGLRKLDLKTGTWEIFTMANGLPANKIAGILPDENGNLWISTYDGLSFFQVEAKLFTNFFTQNGLTHNEFNRFSFFKNADGTLFFGGLNGVNHFKPAEVLASFSQGNDSLLISQISWFAPDGKTPQDQFFGIENGQKITLPPNNRYCSIRLALANYLLPEANRFSWKLEGHDEDWHLNGTNNEITFHYLPAGTYRLRIRAANPTGVWGKNERWLVIEVREFWYKTVWVYLLLAAIISGLFYFFYQTRIRQKLDLAETRRIRELEHLKSRLYTNITHEFRTPLTVILGMTERLTEDGGRLTGAEAKQGLGLIHRNGQNLLRLINQLLDLSKLESGAMKVKLVRADVITYLQYLTESFYSTAQERQIRLVFYPETPKAVINFDEEKMQGIVFNLLSNALKFTPAGGKVVFHAKVLGQNSVEMTSSHPETGAVLQLKIQDTGQGISLEQLPHIFDRFFQADHSNTRKSEGTGIGLALVKELVGLLGGNISVESELGKGSVFTVVLPIATAVDTAVAAASKPSQVIENQNPPKIEIATVQTPQQNDAPLLLVIEDNADVVAYITAILNRDYQIETAANGKIGIEKALELVPDIIISDVMMPEKDGYEVCHTLKNDERTSHIPIILLTAKATQEDKVTGLRAGADAYLQKPFDKAELLVRLEKLTELRRKLQERYLSGSHLNLPGLKNLKNLDTAPTLDDIFLQKIRQVITEKMENSELGILDLCHSTHLSRTQIFRKLKALTGENPTLFIRHLRLERAMELLKTTEMNVSEIAYSVGFSDPNYFSRTFNETYGVAPSAVRP